MLIAFLGKGNSGVASLSDDRNNQKISKISDMIKLKIKLELLYHYSRFRSSRLRCYDKFLTLQGRMDPRNFDPSHSAELLKHMDKQHEVLTEAYRSMLHELQKLQVEQEMLMHKMYEVVSVHGLNQKNDGSGAEHSNTEVNEASEEQ